MSNGIGKRHRYVRGKTLIGCLKHVRQSSSYNNTFNVRFCSYMRHGLLSVEKNET